jgi:hypothetical protein
LGDSTGTRLTESYEVTQPITRLGWFVITHLYGGHDRRADLRTGMQQTLQRIRETAERDIKPDHTSPAKQRPHERQVQVLTRCRAHADDGGPSTARTAVRADTRTPVVANETPVRR